MIPPNDPATHFGCRTLVELDGSRVCCLDALLAPIEGLDRIRKAQFLRYFQKWCARHRMKDEAFKHQTDTELWVFKTHQYRLYGKAFEIAGIRTFVILDSDPSKKTNAAKPAILARAKGRADAFRKENGL